MRYQTLTYTTASILAGANSAAGDTNKAIGPNFVNVNKIKVVPNTIGGSFNVSVFKDAAQTALLAYYPFASPNLYDPVDTSSGSPVEALEGPPIPFEDIDATGKFHLMITNNDGVAHTYTVTVEYEEVPVMGASGSAVFRGAVGIGGTPVIGSLQIFGIVNEFARFGTSVGNSGGYISIYDSSASLIRGYIGFGTNLFGTSVSDFGLYGFGAIKFVTNATSSANTALILNTSQQALHTDGTAGAPSISFINAPTIGLSNSGGDLVVSIAGTARWRWVDSAGNYLPMIDNTNDVGSPTFRPRSIYAGTSMNVGVSGANIISAGGQTTYNGSIAGTAVWSMPFQGASYKLFIIYYAALHDAGGTITFPVTFTKTPNIHGDTAATGITTATTTTLTIALTAATSGFAIVEGY